MTSVVAPGSVSDLEAIVLGVIAGCGPCTAYRIHQTFLESPSLFFSGSAGAIYPVVKRMKSRGLVIAKTSWTGNRRSELLTLSRDGRTAFDSWMNDYDLAADPGFDPVRARLSVFPDAGNGEALIGFLERLLLALQARLEAIESVSGDEFDRPSMLRRTQHLERAALRAKCAVIREWIDEGRL